MIYYVSYHSKKNGVTYIKETHENKRDAFRGKKVWEQYPEFYDHVKVLVELKGED